MRKYSAFLLLFLLLSNIIVAQKSQKADRIIGTYEAISEESNNISHIKISKGSDGKYYGEIIWLKNATYADGKEKVDKLNPDEKMRSRKLIGLKMLMNFEYDIANDEWNNGSIYNPATGKTYKSYIKFEGPQKLFIRGFIGSSWMGLGKTVYWTRLKK